MEIPLVPHESSRRRTQPGEDPMTRLPFFLLASLLLTACPDQSIQAINANPEATITSPEDGEEVFEGFLTMVRGTVSDPDHQTEDLLAAWYLGTDEVCPATAPDWDGATTCELAIGTDETTQRLEVIDPIGAAGSDSIQVNVVATDAPEAAITSPEASGVYYSDQLIVFEGTVTDLEDIATDLVATWESSIEGELEVDAEPNAEGYISGTAYLQEGEHAIELTVVDSTAKTGSDTIVIDVGPPNSDPTCEITAPESGTVGEEGELVLFEAQVDDVDVDADWLTVTWESDKDGELGGSTPYSSGEVQYSYADLSVDTHTITMTVSDEVGATCTHGVVYTVGTAPEVTVTSPNSGDVVNMGESVSFAAEVSDNEDSPTDLDISWTSSIDGTLSTSGADSTGSVAFNSSSLSNGAHDITLTVTDTDGLFATELISLTVNALPTVPTVTISPDPAYTDDDLVGAATGSTDDDGDTVTYGYAWYEDGTLLSSATMATLSSSLTTDGSTYRVVVTPNDGTADGATGEAELEVSNSVPSISSVTISPASPTVTDTLTCSYSGYSDADGDADVSTYEWTVEGVTMGTTSTLAGVFIAGNIVACTVTPDDGKDTGTPVDDTATIVNTPPQVTSVALTPSEVYTNDTLTATVSTSDDDSDVVTVSYAWYVDGSLVGETGSSLSGVTYFDKGQDVYVEAMPNDGTEDGAVVASGTVTVLNTPPGPPTVSIDPAAPDTREDIVCMIDSSASDDDGDTVSYAFDWTVDGSTFGGASTTSYTNDTVLSDSTWTADVWGCTVTPNDGDDDGGSANATAVVSIEYLGWGTTESLASSDGIINGSSGQILGQAVAVLPDIDGDGMVEVLLGSRYADEGATDAGSAYVFMGSTLAAGGSWQLTDADYTISGAYASDQLGRSVERGGDVDGDGIEEILISAHWNDSAGSASGQAYLITAGDLGAIGTASDATYTFTGEDTYHVFSWYQDPAGDVDGDGLGDLIFGAGYYDGYTGKAYVFLASSLVAGTDHSASDADYYIVGEMEDSFLGAGVAGAGDVDADGYDDFIVAAPETNDVATTIVGPGHVYLFLGANLTSTSQLLPSNADATFVGHDDGAGLGWAMTHGDFDADGASDLALGAYLADDGATDAGAIYVFLSEDVGSMGTYSTSAASLAVTGASAGDRLGSFTDFASTADIDLDGASDLLTGAYLDDTAGSQAGRAGLFLASTLLGATTHSLADADSLFLGSAADDYAGFCNAAGDVNGDGLPDVLVSAHGGDGSATNSGQVHLLFSP